MYSKAANRRDRRGAATLCETLKDAVILVLPQEQQERIWYRALMGLLGRQGMPGSSHLGRQHPQNHHRE